MSADVTLKKPWPAEFLTAVRALAALVMRANMHAVRWHGHVHLVAVWTLPCLFVAYTSVCLPVTCEIARRTVPLSTVCACVWVNPWFLVGGEKELTEG